MLFPTVKLTLQKGDCAAAIDINSRTNLGQRSNLRLWRRKLIAAFKSFKNKLACSNELRKMARKFREMRRRNLIFQPGCGESPILEHEFFQPR